MRPPTRSLLTDAVSGQWLVGQALHGAEPDNDTFDDMLTFARGGLTSEELVANAKSRRGLGDAN